MNELYSGRQEYRFEYQGCQCTCKEGKMLDWCMVHGLVVHADLVWLDHADMFLPVKNKAISRDESSLRVVPEHARYPKCNCHIQGGRSQWLCPIHGFRAVCNCQDEWYSDHFCSVHGYVPRAEPGDFKFSFEGFKIFSKYCDLKTQEIAAEFLSKNAAKQSNRQKSPCDDCEGFPDDCRDNCPMDDEDFPDDE